MTAYEIVSTILTVASLMVSVGMFVIALFHRDFLRRQPSNFEGLSLLISRSYDTAENSTTLPFSHVT